MGEEKIPCGLTKFSVLVSTCASTKTRDINAVLLTNITKKALYFILSVPF